MMAARSPTLPRTSVFVLNPSNCYGSLSYFKWYDGKLDRTIAEERLRQAQTPGSYLIRETDRRPGSFVLSFDHCHVWRLLYWRASFFLLVRLD
ncbi:hypothetical protein AOLI_G00229030 [Acnodon oligacanthus]